VLVVDAPEAEQVRRVMARDGVAEEQAHRILAAQASRRQRLALADEIVENAGDLAALDHQVATLHRHYLTLAAVQTQRTDT
jgi:dephospho-CoA kinase